VNLILSPEVTIAFSKANMLSPDGRCHSFDAAANGYVRGEGCAVLVIKRLGDAIRDGDRVLAVIRGSASNQDGRTSGITAPSGPAQQACVARGGPPA
jgi:phthiocerol/phenolphthiocerol synthesis type-I polyketide synthase D